MNVQLGDNIAAMRLGRFYTKAKLLGDILVAVALGNELQDVTCSIRQAIRCLDMLEIKHHLAQHAGDIVAVIDCPAAPWPRTNTPSKKE